MPAGNDYLSAQKRNTCTNANEIKLKLEIFGVGGGGQTSQEVHNGGAADWPAHRQVLSFLEKMRLKTVDAAHRRPVTSEEKCESKDGMKENWKFYSRLYDRSKTDFYPGNTISTHRGSMAACQICKPPRAAKGFHVLLHFPSAVSRQHTPSSPCSPAFLYEPKRAEIH